MPLRNFFTVNWIGKRTSSLLSCLNSSAIWRIWLYNLAYIVSHDLLRNGIQMYIKGMIELKNMHQIVVRCAYAVCYMLPISTHTRTWQSQVSKYWFVLWPWTLRLAYSKPKMEMNVKRLATIGDHILVRHLWTVKCGRIPYFSIDDEALNRRVNDGQKTKHSLVLIVIIRFHCINTGISASLRSIKFIG